MGRRSKKETPFRRILCDLMDQSNLSVRQAANFAEVSPSTLANWRVGANPDDIFAVKRLAKHFGVSLEYLLTGEDGSRSEAATTTAPANSFSTGKIIFDGYAKITIHEVVVSPKKD